MRRSDTPQPKEIRGKKGTSHRWEHDRPCLQEMSCLRKQATGDVSVEVNACPGPDLRKILEELRCQYETLMERNRKETEQWFACKVRCGVRLCPLPAEGEGEVRDQCFSTSWRCLDTSSST